MTTLRDDVHVQLVQFDVPDAEHAERLIEALTGEVERWVADCDGFVSANFHVSAQGTRVVNYAQWRDRAAFEAFLQHPEQPALRQTIGAANPSVVSSHGLELRASRGPRNSS